MSLYVPDHFRTPSPAASHALIETHPLGLLVSVAGRAPMFSPVPVLLDAANGEQGTIRFHLARSNPHCAQLVADGEATFVFQGPQTYVSPDWYVDPELPPTWNYEVVIAHGRATPLDDDGLRRLLTDLSAAQEGRLEKTPWTPDKMGEERIRGLMRGITGFTFAIETIEAKSKLSQNRAAPDRESLREALDAEGNEGARHISRRMAELDPDRES